MTVARGADPIVGAVLPTPGALGALRPVDALGVDVRGGFWAERLRINRERSLGHGFAELERVGTLANFRLAAGAKGRYQALGEATIGIVFPFLDSDVYKWLEAVAWELGRGPDAELGRTADEAIAAVTAAQRPDGYLNTYVQVVGGGEPWKDLAWGHELYCFGHLIQAAVAWHRALGDDRLLEIATRAADAVGREFGPGGRDEIDGHPEIEMALVELYRATGERRHLDLAARMIDLRGHGHLPAGRFGAAYWQDHEPVREASSVAGHAVRQLYLDCGAVDVAVETGDRELLVAVHRRWRDMVATRMYLTGGLGSRHRDEAFGDPFELPPNRAYAETCAAIAGVMLAWRLLLATGDPACADVIERTMFNGVLSGLALDGTRFFYVNPLQRRTHRAATEPGDGERAPWYACACCPPNLMRLLGAWPGLLATTDGRGLQVHQYASAEIVGAVGSEGRRVHLGVETDYPWSGRVVVTVRETPAEAWTLGLRIPAWSEAATLDDGATVDPVEAGTRVVERTRAWAAGDRLVLDLAMPARTTEPDPRIDAIRGCLALERGPLVYCVESADLPDGVDLEEIALAPDTRPTASPRPDVAAGLIGISAPAVRGAAEQGANAPIDVAAIPYFAWANRGPGAMRVWLPAGPASTRSPG
ncbi:MAG: glycoside hydrolase family 127 protein [Chloroflexi bacterium]|nr:glycoside hydrolase family 127 protein [Chloroflexota bacterium]